MSRRTENIILEKRGYHQGQPDTEACRCDRCGKAISGTRSWWRRESDGEVSGYCRPCVMFGAFMTEKEVQQ